MMMICYNFPVAPKGRELKHAVMHSRYCDIHPAGIVYARRVSYLSPATPAA